MDMTLWTLLALALFLALMVVLKVPQWIGLQLDGRAKRIADELAQAKHLREEAQAILEECKRKTAAAETQAQEMVAMAQNEAQALVEQARQKMQDYVTRRQQLAEEKISRAEAEALEQVKARVIDVAAGAAAQILREEVDGKAHEEQFETSLTEVSTRLH